MIKGFAVFQTYEGHPGFPPEKDGAYFSGKIVYFFRAPHPSSLSLSREFRGHENSGGIHRNSLVTISLSPGNETGLMAECWVSAETPSGIWSYVYPQGWQSRCVPSLQAPLSEIESFPVWDGYLGPRQKINTHSDLSWEFRLGIPGTGYSFRCLEVR